MPRIKRPSPALVVAIIALVAAIVVPAYALTKKDKKQVKKLAGAEITKRAPGLAVASANTATSADNATNAEALSGNTIVGEGDLDGPGALTNSVCTAVTEPVPGAQAGDHVVLTPPSVWPSYEINLTARVTTDTVTYEICNQSGALQNFGTAPPVRFLVFR